MGTFRGSVLLGGCVGIRADGMTGNPVGTSLHERAVRGLEVWVPLSSFSLSKRGL